jgi:hypothetical protein
MPELDVQTGLLAEYESPEALVEAARRARAAGLERLEAYTPFEVPEVESVLALKRSRIPHLVFLAGLAGAAFAYGLQYWISAVDYPLNVGATPANSGPAYIPITFETMVLFAALTAFISLFAFTGLPKLWHPVFEAPGFESATIHRFWLGVDGRDPRFDAERTRRLLLEAGALRVVAPGAAP